MKRFERYITENIDYMSEDKLFSVIDEIEEYKSNNEVNLEEKILLDEVTSVLYEELSLRSLSHNELDEYKDDVFLSELKRKSKVVTKRASKMKEFKKNENTYRSSFLKASFVFNDVEKENEFRESFPLGSSYDSKSFYNKKNGRYKRYYESAQRKPLQRQSNKILRQRILDLPVKGSMYKRALDIDWIIN